MSGVLLTLRNPNPADVREAAGRPPGRPPQVQAAGALHRGSGGGEFLKAGVKV